MDFIIFGFWTFFISISFFSVAPTKAIYLAWRCASIFRARASPMEKAKKTKKKSTIPLWNSWKLL